MTVVYIVLFICVLVAFFVIIHKSLLASEMDKLVAHGKIVKIDGYNMHVYAEGEQQKGKPTLVVMSGSSIPSLVYNYKKLYILDSEKFSIKK